MVIIVGRVSRPVRIGGTALESRPTILAKFFAQFLSQSTEGLIVQPGTVMELTQMRAVPEAAPAPMRRWRLPFPCLLPALASGLLLWLCYFPIAWGWLAWLALVPLLGLVRAEGRPAQIFLGAFTGGLVFFYPALSWMTVADYRMVYTWGMLATYCALYFPIGIAVIRRLDRATRWPLTVTVPLAWVGLEFVRSFFGTGFPWYFLGHTQHQFLAVIQIADIGGVYAVSLLVAAVNGWLFECLYAGSWFRHAFRQRDRFTSQVRRAGGVSPPVTPLARRLWRQGLVVAGLLLAALGYGGWRLSQDRFPLGPLVALLQGNVDQRLRNEAAQPQASKFDKAQEILAYYRFLAVGASQLTPPPDLVIWPETSFPFRWIELPADLNKVPDQMRRDALVLDGLLCGHAQELRTSQLFGVEALLVTEDGREKKYNSGLLINGNGKKIGKYDKIHRVPFGEYVPFRDWLPFMDRFAPYDYDYGIQVGEKMTRFPFGPYHFGVLICFEDTDPILARQYARRQDDGPAVDFLVNISNDGWFDGSSQHEEHLALSRFRAIECRRALCRAVNMGISAVIDGNGRVRKAKEAVAPGKFKVPIPVEKRPETLHLWAAVPELDVYPDLPVSEWAAYKKEHGILMANIPIDDRFSLYAVTGDWLPCGCWLALAGVVVWGRRKRRKVAVG